MDLNPYQASTLAPHEEADVPLLAQAREALRGPSMGLFWIGGVIGATLLLMGSLGTIVDLLFLTGIFRSRPLGSSNDI